MLASVGAVGDAYDNAPAESFVDSFKTELIADRVWRSRSQLELATVEWIGWFNHERLHESLGDLPPVEFEAFHAARRLISGDGSVAALPPRLSAARTGPTGAPAGRNGADPGRPSIQIAADASLGSPYGLAALDVGTGPTTLP